MTDHAPADGELTRREALTVLASVPMSLVIDSGALLAHARRYVAARAAGDVPLAPRFFTTHEWGTVRMLVDYLFPRDDRSGSATDAGVPEFVDFMAVDRPDLQTPMRGGLAWLDTYCTERFGARFADCPPADRTRALDAIAWPARAPAELGPGVAFFSQLRDLAATGFWTSPMGVADLQYLGNTVVREWTGCPQAALDKLDVAY